MTVHDQDGVLRGADSADLREWLTGLAGCPTVHRTVLLTCPDAAHTEPATWTYVEADPTGAAARCRCLGCGRARWILRSEDHWSFPSMWACLSCGQSIAEVAAGLHLEAGPDGLPTAVTWLVLAARCTNCGRLDGLTDMLVPALPAEQLSSQL